MEIQSQVCRRLPRQRVWWVLRRRCAVDRRGDGHIPGRCSKCPRVDCLDSESQSCSWPQFTTTRICEDVSDTQNARRVHGVSGVWSAKGLRGRAVRVNQNYLLTHREFGCRALSETSCQSIGGRIASHGMETATAAVRKYYWNASGRWLVFALAASSIACLLADFYGLCPMRIFTPFI